MVIEQFHQMPKMVKDHYWSRGTAAKITSIRITSSMKERIVINFSNSTRDVWAWEKAAGWVLKEGA